MKERKTKRFDVRVSEKDLDILKILKARLGLSTYDIAKKAIESYYFSIIKQEECNENLLKK